MIHNKNVCVYLSRDATQATGPTSHRQIVKFKLLQYCVIYQSNFDGLAHIDASTATTLQRYHPYNIHHNVIKKHASCFATIIGISYIGSVSS